MSPPPAWLAQTRAQAACGPAQARVALRVDDAQIGSVAPEIIERIGPQRLLDKRHQLSLEEHDGAPAWHLQGSDASAALNALAEALRAAGCCGPWRGEQLAVCDARGRRMGTIERGAVRPLGIATDAVHLVGVAAGGAGLWLQQRSFSKAYRPGEWDTLMGGMVSAADTPAQALARETREEAGLAVDALAGLREGTPLWLDQPSDEGGPCLGHLRERITWWSATLPAGTLPANQDGEVERFECWSHAQVRERLAQGVFTPEAALVLAAYYGW